MSCSRRRTHFIKADRRDRADKREAGRERKQQRKHFIAEGQPHQHDANDRVDEAEKDDVGPIRPEIADTSDQGVPEFGGLNPADHGQRDKPARLAAPHGATQRPHG